MLGGVSPPRTPAFGARQQFDRRGTPPVRAGKGPKQADICGRKRVRLSELPHRDVLRRPLSDASQLSELNDGLLKRTARTEYLGIAGNGRSEPG